VVTGFMPWEAMFSFDSDQFVTHFQAIHDQQIVKSFNNPSNQPFLQVESVV
jgi:hypothetical protein